jgi:hypothetical protein
VLGRFPRGIFLPKAPYSSTALGIPLHRSIALLAIASSCRNFPNCVICGKMFPDLKKSVCSETPALAFLLN